ncbi:hypothetical protein LXL04_000831 [Taraxacum kok-saghyz]
MADRQFHRRSKEIQLAKTSISVFVTNFPDSFLSKDLWESCSQYGRVSDVFIPANRSKAGKRYAFVRFLKADNIDLIVSNLCTIWHGKLRLNANISRFPRNVKPSVRVHGSKQAGSFVNHVDKPVHSVENSYAAAVQWANYSAPTLKDAPSLVLDDSCLNLNDQSFTLVGKVKEFGSILKLAHVLSNEGFPDVVIRYMGGCWVSLEFQNAKVNDKFKAHKGVSSWFSVILPWSETFVVDNRGLPSVAWTSIAFQKIANRWGDLLYAEDPNDTNLYRKRLCIKTQATGIIMETFKVIVQGKVFILRAREVIGWNPEFVEEEEDDEEEDNDNSSFDLKDHDVEEELEAVHATENAPHAIKHDHATADSQSAPTPDCPPGFTPPKTTPVVVYPSGNQLPSTPVAVPAGAAAVVGDDAPQSHRQEYSPIVGDQPERNLEASYMGGRGRGCKVEPLNLLSLKRSAFGLSAYGLSGC